MKVNEVKETREVIVRTEYIAEDGTKFRSQEECEEYEQSAIVIIKRKLKKLNSHYVCDLLPWGYCDSVVEVFDVQSQEDLDNLEMYLRLKVCDKFKNEDNDYNSFVSKGGIRKDYVFENVTYGHEVMIFWDYEDNYFWVYRDGSIKGLLDFAKERLINNIYPKEEKENDNQ